MLVEIDRGKRIPVFGGYEPSVREPSYRVLEQVFSAAKRGFESSILGPRPDELITAVHSDSHVLIKIHGDCRDRTSRVFTVEEYEDAYGVGPEESQQGSRARIGSLAWLLFTNRPLLFLGCSLERDRTVQVLCAIQQRLHGLKHYAILAAENSAIRWEERERRLDKLGVRALWFYPGRYEEIELLLREMLERASTTPLEDAASKKPPSHSVITPSITLASIQAQLQHKLPPTTDRMR